MAEKGRRWSPYIYTFGDPIRFTDPDGMWPDWLDNAVNKVNNTAEAAATAINKVKNTATAAVAAIKKEASKYTVKLDVKQSIGIQGAIETPFGDVKVNVASVILSKDNITVKNGKVTQSKEMLNNKIGNDGKTTDTHSIEVESSVAVGMVSSGAEAGQSFKLTGSNAYVVPGSNSSYTKVGFLGAEDKTTTNADGKESYQKSQTYTFGAAVIYGFQVDISILKNK